MEDLQEFTEHLKIISGQQWEALFALIPEIERTSVFGTISESKKREDGSYTFPYWIQAEIITITSEVIFKLDILPVYDWMRWDEGRELLNSGSDFNNHDTITLCKLLTYIYRSDRFNDGALIRYFESGTMIKILKALKNNIDKQ
jgi:hypothetical protein